MNRQEQRPALVIGVLPRVVVPIARVLRRNGFVVHGASLHRRLPMRSRALESFTVLPSAERDPEAFRREFLALVERFGIGSVFPGGDEVLHALAPLYDELKGRVTLCCPEPAVYRQVLTKEITLEIAGGLGIPVPREYRLQDLGELAAAREHIRFPVIAKPRSKFFEHLTGIRFRRFDRYADLEAMFQEHRDFGEGFLIQEYLPGRGVGVEIAMFDGKPAVLFQHRRVREIPVAGGVSVAADAEPVDATLAEYAVALLRALRWQGIAMVEFRQDPATGAVALMEVNGRFWGSIALSCHAGLEFPMYALRIAQGKEPPAVVSYSLVRFRWLLGDVRRLLDLAVMVRDGRVTMRSAVREIGAFCADSFGPARDALWSWSDPRPALDEAVEAARLTLASAAGIVIKTLLPGRMVRRVKNSRQLPLRASIAYLFRSTFGGSRNELQRLPRSPRSIVFICHGNIMRSPAAEHFFRAAARRRGLDGLAISSAGVRSTPGKPADPRALKVAPDFGIDLADHRAQPVTAELAAQTDLLIVMDYLNYFHLVTRFPDVRNKIVFMGGCGGEHSRMEVEDPYHGGLADVRFCYGILQKCAERLADALARGTRE